MGREIVFLQGPHGPFFSQLARHLGACDGVTCHRIGFNAGDSFFSTLSGVQYVAYRGSEAEWPTFFRDYCVRHHITAVVLYGDVRVRHKVALEVCRDLSIETHVLEEGYFRPHWVTCEPDGVNANSATMQTDVSEMADSCFLNPRITSEARWGDMKEHIFWSLVYHFALLVGYWRYPGYKTHRDQKISWEAKQYFKRIINYPHMILQRKKAMQHMKETKHRLHAVLLQLSHDSSFQAHSDFKSQEDFIALCIREFANSLQEEGQLIFKAHPLEGSPSSVACHIKQAAQYYGVKSRVYFCDGGRLGPFLDKVATVTTVNSTAGLQALFRGIPVKVMGRAIYDKPSLTSNKSLREFFEDPNSPDSETYTRFSNFVIDKTQVFGGFYSRKARKYAVLGITSKILGSPSVKMVYPSEVAA